MKNRNSRDKRLVFIWIMMLAIPFLGACEQAREVKDEATLEQIALQYWTNRLVTRDYQAAYKREEGLTEPFETYRGLMSRNEKFKFSKLKIGNVKIEGDHATLYVALKCRIPGIPKDIERNFKDVWLYASGEWKHEFSKNQP